MRHDRRLVLGIFLTGAMVAAGCSGGSSSGTDGGAAGKTGAGGAANGAGGAGGGSVDAGGDHGPTTDAKPDTSGAGGAGGSADAHADVATDVATDAAVDQSTDTGAGDVVADMAMDTGPQDVGPCVTNYGAGNQVLYAFDGGANGGWTAFVKFDDSHTMFTTSLAASFTEGHSCPGSLLLGANFNAYGTREAASIERYYGGIDWTGYKALHAWIKVESADPSALNGVYFYATSGANQAFYQSDFAAGANLGGWQQVVIDLTRAPNAGAGVMLNDVMAIGFEALLNTAPAVGAPAAPSEIFLLADDIWLEAAPPADAGTSDAADAAGQ